MDRIDMQRIAVVRNPVSADDGTKNGGTVDEERGPRLLTHVALVSLLCLAGCSRGGLKLAPVDGLVTYNGAPVADAGVVFSPCNSALGPPASGSTDADGRFILVTANRPGAVIGDHQVAISKDQSIVVGYIHGMPQYSTKQELPPRYSTPATSNLKVTVVDDDNHFEFKLVSK